MTGSLDYRKFLDERFDGMGKLMNAQFDAMHDKLDGLNKDLGDVKIQTTKTNGRVTILEGKVDDVERDLLTHPMNCNQAKEIEKISKDIEKIKAVDDAIKELEIKKDRKMSLSLSTIGTWIVVAGFILAVILGIHQIKLIRQQIDGFGVPFVKNARTGEFVALPDSTKIVFFPNDSITYTIIKTGE
jgi:hypothetical protein